MIEDLILTDGSIEKVPSEFHQFLSQVEWHKVYWKSYKGRSFRAAPGGGQYVAITGTDLPPEQGHPVTGTLQNVIRNLIILQRSNPDVLAKILEEKTIRPTLFYSAAGPFWKPPE